MDSLETLRQRVTTAKQSFLREAQPRSTTRAATRQQETEEPTRALLFAASALQNIGHVLEVVCGSVYSFWHALQPYEPAEWFAVVYGLFLVLFGGAFVTLVECGEAARQFGWQRIQLAVTALYYEVQNARRALDRDNKVDDNRDGVEDVKQLTAPELALRRMTVLSASVNPDDVSAALEGLSMAAVAVTATLRVRFAKAITLGSAIGDVLSGMLSPLTSALLRACLTEAHEKWIPVVNKYAFRYAGMCASWAMMRVVGSVLCATRGSAVVVAALCEYAVRHGHVRGATVRDGRWAVVAAWAALSCCGLYAQLRPRPLAWRAPFNVLLLPLWVGERLIVFIVGRGA